MNDAPKVAPADEIWPPAPTLPPPERVRPASFLVIYPILSRLLMSVGAGIFGCSLDYVREWFTHRAHFINWELVIQCGVQLFALQLFLWLGLPALARAEARKKECKKKAATALEAEALAAQSATE